MAPRRRIDLGNGEVEAVVAGDGRVTVVFESGLGSPLEVWDTVVPAVAERARTLRYDHRRAPARGKVPARRVADLLTDLEHLLAALDLEPPYVLVGHSWGGVIARLFVHARPADVAGLVLVDATHEAVDTRALLLMPALYVVVNILRRAKFVQRALIRQLCPPEASPAYRVRIEGRFQNPKLWRIGLRTSRAEASAIRPALAQLKSTCPDLPAVPTHVLTAGGEKSKMARTNREAWQVAAQRAGAPYTNVATSRHLMPIDAPDVVVSAILGVLDLVR